MYVIPTRAESSFLGNFTDFREFQVLKWNFTDFSKFLHKSLTEDAKPFKVFGQSV